MKNNWINYISVILLTLVVTVNSGCVAAFDLGKSLKKGRDIVIKDVTFDEDIDLTTMIDYVTVAPGKKLATVTSNIVFVNCQFKGFSAFKYEGDYMYLTTFSKEVMFQNCFFDGAFNISYATFEQGFSCTETGFSSPVDMSKVWFKGRSSSFNSASFYDKTKFTNSIFENTASFLDATFDKQVLFQNSVFKGTVFFGASDFIQYAGFDNTTFYGEVSFDKAIFENTTIFEYANFLIEGSFIEVAFNGETSFANALFSGRTDFGGAQIKNKFNIDQAAFLLGMPEELAGK